MTKIILTLAVVALPAAVSAQWPAPVERALSREYTDCMARGAAAAGVTSGMMSCSGGELYRQDARLNRTYRITMQRLPRARQERLQSDERAWIKRRDGGCRREAGIEGTAAGLNYSQCVLRETISRRLWLERYR